MSFSAFCIFEYTRNEIFIHVIFVATSSASDYKHHRENFSAIKAFAHMPIAEWILMHCALPSVLWIVICLILTGILIGGLLQTQGCWQGGDRSRAGVRAVVHPPSLLPADSLAWPGRACVQEFSLPLALRPAKLCKFLRTCAFSSNRWMFKALGLCHHSLHPTESTSSVPFNFNPGSLYFTKHRLWESVNAWCYSLWREKCDCFQNISEYATYTMKCQRARMRRDGLSIFQ